ncbi:hypothetical protein GCM10007047_19630 [Cerasicoccus arenae]|uniref:Uncharacterized protein n=1 Tax=Cerasicoccus arenae TaxID=424488 RepID=A0A8J3GEF4_9BACT|nr:hypothetical protein GCM10007047_19630 [Cerasicoccus arenae]
MGPIETGQTYAITGPGGYWNLNVDGSIVKLDGPISVRILELHLPAWAKVELMGVSHAPFWINLQNTASIIEINHTEEPNQALLEVPPNATITVDERKVSIQ